MGRVRSALVIACLVAGGLSVGLSVVAPSAQASIAPPSLVTTAASVTANPTLQWHAIAGASTYRVQVSLDPQFAATVYAVDTVALEATPDADLPLGTLYWRVAGIAGGSVGPFSSNGTFTKSWTAPVPTAPVLAPGDTVAHLAYPTAPPVFSWSPVAGAASYVLEIDDAADFVSPQSFTTTNTSFTLPEPQTAGQQYYWHVRAQSSTTTVLSPWSSAIAYETDWLSAPTLIDPPLTDGSDVVDPVFAWDTVPGAASYQLQISPNGDWANNITKDVELKSTSWTPQLSLPSGGYFWRVRAIDDASPRHYGTWSDVANGYPELLDREWTAAPTQLTPNWDPAHPGAVPHVTNALTFSWTPVTHAAYYELQVATNVNFSQGSSTVNCFTNHTQWTPYTQALLNDSATPPPGGCTLDGMVWAAGITYYWRVRGIDAPVGLVGLWSASSTGAPFRFVRDPDWATPLSPANHSTGPTPALTWQTLPGVDKYLVTVKNSNNQAVVSGAITYTTGYSFPAKLDPASGPYYWAVQSVDGAGVASALPQDAGWWSFSVDDASAATTDAEQLQTPADGADAVRMPAMSWSPVTGAARYVVHYAVDGVELPPLAVNLTTTSFVSTAALDRFGWFYWWVEAQDVTGKTLSTSAFRTFYIDEFTDLLAKGAYQVPAGCTQDAARLCADTPTLSWTPQRDAAVYVVTVANDRNFTNVVRRYVTAYPTLTPRESLLDNQAGQAYYWFARPCLDALLKNCGPGEDNSTAVQNRASFQKHSVAVSPLSPGDGAVVTGGRTRFRWQDYELTGAAATPAAAQEAKQYHIQVSKDADFSSVLDDEVVDGTTYTANDRLYPNGPVYWRVQAVDGSNNSLTYSAPRVLTKQSPVPTPAAPVDGSHVPLVPSLKWSPTDFAATYRVELYRNGDTTFSAGNLAQSATTKTVAWTPTTGLAEGNYAWRVRATDTDNLDGPWSRGQTFTLSADKASLSAPADGITLTSGAVSFRWTPVTGAASYRWQLSTDAGFSSLMAGQTTVTTAWTPPSPFPDMVYSWRVQAIDGSGNVISTSAPRTVGKDATPPTVLTAVPAPNGSVAFTFGERIHGLTAAAIRVVAEHGSAAAAGTVRVAADLLSATWTPSAALVTNQVYTVSVVAPAQDLAGNVVAANSTTFRAPAFVDNVAPALRERWAQVRTGSASGGGYDENGDAGASATYHFTGTSIAVLGTLTAQGGTASIVIDGTARRTVAFHAAHTAYRRTVFSMRGLSSAAHTITVKVLGAKASGSKGTLVGLDAFRVGSATVESGDARVREQFRRVGSGVAAYGSYDLASTPAGASGRASYLLTWRGTTVTAFLVYGPGSGKVSIYLDGAGKGTFILGATSQYVNAPLQSSGLRDTVHSLRLDAVAGKGVPLDYVTTG